MIAIPHRLRSPRLWAVLTFVWFCVLWASSSQASYLPPALFSFQDKVEHALFFMGGTFCFITTLKLMGWQRLLWPALLFAMVIGASDEFHQTFVPGRSGNDLGDWLADSLGGLLAFLISRKVR
jgi:VanZ family protein